MDRFLLEGSKALFVTALSILHFLQPFLLRVRSIPDIAEILQSQTYEEEVLLRTMEGAWLQDLSMDLVLELRHQHRWEEEAGEGWLLR